MYRCSVELSVRYDEKSQSEREHASLIDEHTRLILRQTGSITGVPSSRLEKVKNYLSIHRRLAKAKNKLSIYSYRRHGCARWNVTFHFTRC